MDTKTIIKKLGGTAKTAALCEISPAAVSQWIENGIPPGRLMFLRLARPDVFKEIEGTSGSPIDGDTPPSRRNLLECRAETPKLYEVKRS